MCISTSNAGGGAIECSTHRRASFYLVYSFFIGALLIFAYFSPVLLNQSRVIPSVFPDGKVFTWNFWWAQKALRDGHSLFESKFVFHPFGSSLHLHTFVPALTATLSFIFSEADPAALFTYACMLVFLLNFVSALMLFRALSASLIFGTLLALLFTFHPYFIGHLRGGHLNLLFLSPVLLISHALAGIFLGSGTKHGFQIAAAVGLLAYTNLYYLYFSVILLAFALIWGAICHQRPVPTTLITKIILPTAAGLVIGLPVLVPTALQVMSRAYSPDHSPRAHSTDILSYILPSQNQAVGALTLFEEFQSRVRVNSAEAGASIGISLVLLLLVLRKKQSTKEQRLFKAFSMIGASTFMLLSLGPVMDMNGEPVVRTFFYDWFMKVLPFFPSVPARFSIMVVLLLNITLAVSLKEMSLAACSTLQRLSIILLLACMVLEFFPSTIKTTAFHVPDSLALLRDNQEIKAVHDMGAPHDSMMRQIYHGKPITKAFLARQPKDALKLYKHNVFLRYISGLNKEKNIVDLIAGWEELQIDAVIIEKGDTDVLQRARTIAWLSELSSDDALVIFTAKLPV